MKFRIRLAPAVALALLLAAYQNCTRSTFSSSTGPEAGIDARASSGGNGEGYDGKPYVFGNCGMATSPRKRYVLRADARAAALVRDNCQDLPAPHAERPVTAQNFKAAEPEVLIFDSEVLSAETLARSYLAVCRGLENGRDPISLHIWQDTAGAFFGEMIRVRQMLGKVERTSDRALYVTSKTGEISFVSQDAFLMHSIIEGEITALQGLASVSYIIPPVQDWNVESDLTCDIN
ncbi:MAG: hypothetical protein AB7F86_01010 [Bdellovibrionales bacterium]